MRWLVALFVVVGGCKKKGNEDYHAPPPPPRTAGSAPERDAPPPPARVMPRTPTDGFSSPIELVTGKAQADSLAIDASGSVVTAVSFEGSISAAGETFAGGSGGVLLVRSPLTGGPVTWVKQIAKDRNLENVSIAIDSKGEIVLAGSLYGEVTLGTTQLRTAGEKDILVAKLAADGTPIWAHSYGSTEPDRPAAIAVDAKDNISIGGYYAGTVDFGGKKLSSKNDAEMFVARYTSAGKLAYATRISGGGTEQSELYDITLDAAGNTVAIGGFGGKVDLGGKPLAGTKGAAAQTYVAAFGAGGQLVWSAAYGTGPMTLANTVAADGKGNVAIAGSGFTMPPDQNNMVSFDVASGKPTSGSMSTFVALLGPDHAARWTLPIASAGMGDGVEIAFADTGDVLLAGDAASAPFGQEELAGVTAYYARVSAAGKLIHARAIPGAAPHTAFPRIASRGAKVVLAVQTGDPASALVLLSPN